MQDTKKSDRAHEDGYPNLNISAGRDINAEQVGQQNNYSQPFDGSNLDAGRASAKPLLKWLLASTIVAGVVFGLCFVFIPVNAYALEIAAAAGAIAFGVMMYFNPATWHKRLVGTIITFYLVAKVGYLAMAFTIDTPWFTAEGGNSEATTPLFDICVVLLVAIILFWDVVKSTRVNPNN